MNIYKRGEIFWVKFMIDGKLNQYSCRTKDKAVAQEIASAIYADVLRDRFNLPTKNIPKDKYIFKDILYKEYIKSCNIANSTLKPMLSRIKHFNIFFEKEINSITELDIKSFQILRKSKIMNLPKNKNKREPEISLKEINHEIQILNNFFNYYIKKEYIDKNPCSGIKKLNELCRLKTLSDKDINKLIDGATNKLTKDLITFLILTGCRKGEALNLKWDNVDLQNNVIAIKGTKTKYDRYIPISKPLKELLCGIEKRQDCLYVFNNNGVKIGDFRRSFHTACRNAGLKDLRIHDLRHVFASKMVMGGTSLYITGELLGHRTTQMTKRYSHLVPETLKKAVDDVFK